MGESTRSLLRGSPSHHLRRHSTSSIWTFLDIRLSQCTDLFNYRISDAETRIGGGLIEEVIEVAEGELKLVETIAESQVYVSPLIMIRLEGSCYVLTRANADIQRRWEELEEKPPQGQWEYFARDQHTKGTQEPPNK